MIVLFCKKLSSQINIPEEKNLEFQEHFFDALTEKGIQNYKKAIDKLSLCNEIIPKNTAVLFEFSKNYHFLNNTPEAIMYANFALENEPENIWLLQHLVNIYKKAKDYKNAIKIQKRIVKKYPKKKKDLVFIYLKQKNYTAAENILIELEKVKMLNLRLRYILKILRNRKKNKQIIKKEDERNLPINLKARFEQSKSYKNLKQLLINLDFKNDSDLLKYSEKGLSLFPAQPFVYLMHGKALNKNKKYEDAIETLQNGIDYLIENNTLKAKLYKELIKSYKGLGDKKNVKKYQKKLNLN